MENNEIKLDIVTAIEFVTENRDNALEQLNHGIKMKYGKEYISKCLDAVLRINDQINILEDCLIMLKVIQQSSQGKIKEKVGDYSKAFQEYYNIGNTNENNLLTDKNLENTSRFEGNDLKMESPEKVE